MISILIPTLNRNDILLKTIKYYEKQKFDGELIIGDSSDNNSFQKLNNLVKKINLDIKVFHTPKLNNYATTNYLIDKSIYEFCIWSPDDDLFYVPILKDALNFLKSNKDYCTVWGITMMYRKNKNKKFDKYFINFQTSKSLDANDPIIRLQNHYNFYTSVFIGLSRKKALKEALSGTELVSVSKSTSKENWDISQQLSEIFVSSQLVIQGKIKSLNSLYWIRDIHDNRYEFSRIDDKIFNDKTIETIIFFENKIKKLLSKNKFYSNKIDKIGIRSMVLRFLFREKLNEKNKIINFIKYYKYKIRYFYTLIQFKKIQGYI